MPSFFWDEGKTRVWEGHFGPDALGSVLWDGWQPKAPTFRRLFGSLADLRLRAEPPRPTLFISHRREDVSEALRVARLAWQEGFDVWLDVLDPFLGGLRAPNPVYSLVVACIIEMALLNSTHLVAVITPRANGSQWVPYEFGRVKADQIVTSNASSWLLGLNVTDVPEYLLLCPIHKTEADLRRWLHRKGASIGRSPYGRTPPEWLPPVS